MSKNFQNEYLIYNRKSLDDTDNQKNSLSYQTNEAIRYSQLENLPVAHFTQPNYCTNGVINEKHSGFKEGVDIEIDANGRFYTTIERPKFQKMVADLFAKKFKGVIFLCWDRASRNKFDNYIIDKLIKAGVDVRFVQATYDQSSSGDLHKDIDGMFAIHHSRNTSEKVRKTTKKQRDEGVCTYRAPIGYLNTGDPRHKPFDKVRAPLVKHLFEKYSEGTWSMSDLAKWANDNGLTMPAVRRKRTTAERLGEKEVFLPKIERPLDSNKTHKILTNQFYIGKIIGSDRTWVRSTSHEPLVSEELFYRVQNLLNSKNVSVRYKETLYFPYRGLIRCGECNRLYSPYKQKGIDYYGARCVKGCKNTNRNINADFIEQNIARILAELSFTDSELKEIDNRVREDISELVNEQEQEQALIDSRKKKLRADLKYLRENKIHLLRSGAFKVEDYVKEESFFKSELADLEQQENRNEARVDQVVKDTIILSELLKDAYLYYILANPTEKQQIIVKIFSELTLFDNTLNYKCREGFKVLENRKSLLCDPTGNRTPISSVRGVCPSR